MGHVSRVVVATGTKREAAVLRGSGWTVVAGGGDATDLRNRLREAEAGTEAILSFGMAGALDPRLRVGDWVVGDGVVGGAEASCDPLWRERLVTALGAVRVGRVFADGQMIVDAAEKFRIAAASGAVAVDMESHVAAAVARERRLPMAIARCVSDRADQPLPPAFAVAMRPGGALAIGAMLQSILSQPGQIGAVIRTGQGFTRAMKSLERGARAIVRAAA